MYKPMRSVRAYKMNFAVLERRLIQLLIKWLQFIINNICCFVNHFTNNYAARNVSSGRPYVLPVMFFPFFIRRATSELPRPIAVKLCHMIAIWVFFIMQVQKFGGPFPKEIGGQKHAKFGAISDNFKLRSRISLERLKMSKIGKRTVRARFLSRSTKKVR